VVERCIAEGLVGGEGFAVDASLIEADANRQRSVPGLDWNTKRDPERASRSVREYLATLDDAAWGAATDVVPKFVSPSDPAAQWTGALRGPAFFAYADNYLVDLHSAVIVDPQQLSHRSRHYTRSRLGFEGGSICGMPKERRDRAWRGALLQRGRA
jgi:hypothetical protein